MGLLLVCMPAATTPTPVHSMSAAVSSSPWGGGCLACMQRILATAGAPVVLLRLLRALLQWEHLCTVVAVQPRTPCMCLALMAPCMRTSNPLPRKRGVAAAAAAAE
eukprot:scaffold153088_cov19-Tisochrysis_lutea.AAC.2